MVVLKVAGSAPFSVFCLFVYRHVATMSVSSHEGVHFGPKTKHNGYTAAPPLLRCFCHTDLGGVLLRHQAMHRNANSSGPQDNRRDDPGPNRSLLPHLTNGRVFITWGTPGVHLVQWGVFLFDFKRWTQMIYRED